MKISPTTRKFLRITRTGPLVFLLSLLLLAASIAVPPISQAIGHTTEARRATASATAVRRQPKRAEFVPGDVLVRFRPTASIKSASHATMTARAADGRDIPVQVERLSQDEVVDGLRLAHVAPEDTLDAIKALRQRPDVLYAEPNYIRHKTNTPNDTEFINMWALNNVGQDITDTDHVTSDPNLCPKPPCTFRPGVAGADIKAEQAWNITTGSRSIVVGVIDEGIDINHPDLQANIWTNPSPGSISGITGDVHGYDFPDKTGNVFAGNGTYPKDQTDAHGTHVAGTIGAVGNNGMGTVGINWQVSLMSLKVLGPNGGADSDITSAYMYAKEMRDLWVSSGGTQGANIRVLNNSYGGPGFSQSQLDAINALNSSGILFVAAAGNDTSNNDDALFQSYPADYNAPNVIAVAATDRFNNLADYSDYGPHTVSIAAPGSLIISTTPNNTYDFYYGTSMATPHVTGTAALICAKYPNISVAQLRAALVYSGDVLPSLVGMTYTQRRLNAFSALQNAPAVMSDTTPPAAIGDLHVSAVNGRTITLNWTAPGDDGNTGQAALYDLSFADGSETIPLSTLIPHTAGTTESFNINIPVHHTTGTITIKTIDKAGNTSAPASISVSDSAAAADPYVVSQSANSPLSTGGTALNLKDDDAYYTDPNTGYPYYTLPFAFPFFGQAYNQVAISTNGALYFSPPVFRDDGTAGDVPSSVDFLKTLKMIGGVWDDLRTDQNSTDDVYVVQPDANTIIFRWQAVTFDTPLTTNSTPTRGQNPVNFEIELHSDGRIITRFGGGNTNLFPVVGISAGEPDGDYVVTSDTNEYPQDNLTTTPATTINLTNAATVNYTPRSVVAPPANPIDDPTFFVTQHYLDFLNRQPDQAGLNFWVGQITSCNGDPNCIDIKRQNVSAAYFLSREFQETGFFVIKVQRAAFGHLSQNAAKRISRQQFVTDSQTVGKGFVDGQPGADAILDQNKTAYVQAVAGSANFIAQYPTTLSASAYVDALFTTAGVTPTSAERQTAINAFGSGDTAGRAAVLRSVAETDSVKNAEFNPAFVLLQYFGYLRRNPTDPPDNNDNGYQFWLNKLTQFNGDYIGSQMVRSFIVSTEYRQRFGPA